MGTIDPGHKTRVGNSAGQPLEIFKVTLKYKWTLGEYHQHTCTVYPTSRTKSPSYER
jgi:hypothetical protein